MIARFFIDRPIFAAVLSIVITLIGGIALFALPIAQYPRITPPGVSVSISYPGASAAVVADTVAAPIEQQVNGVEGMLYMSSQMGNDGTYTLTVTFDIGTDLNTDLVMVQNRVTLAMPQLPTAVQNQGITIRKKTPDILMIVNFFSPDGRYDDIYLSNFATIYVRDELLRVYGVSDINYLGQRDYSIRVWLDPQKLASRNMTAMDVAQAISEQNLDAPAGRIGQPPAALGQSSQLPIDTLGRLTEPEQFRDIIVKVDPATASNTSSLSADSVNGGSAQASQPASGSSSSSGSGGGAGSAAGGGQMQIDTIGGASTVDATAGTISPPTIGPTIRLGAAGGSGTTGTATSTASITITGPTTVFPAPTTGGFTGGGTTGGGATAGGGGTTGGGATTAGGTTFGGAAGGAGGSSTTNSQRIGSALSTTLTGSSAASLALPSPSDAVVRLRDVARVEMGAQNYNQSCTFDGHPSIGLSIYQLPGTNALDVAERVQARMKELKSRFPDGVDYSTAYDTTPFIRESVADVFKTLLEAVVLVGIVVLVFLQDWKAMILPMIDVPVSLIGTFAVMAALGFSLNNISLFGLVLAIGIVVDDAIVVLENIERLMATGLEVRAATIKAMDEVTGPIVAVALVLSAVFVPCAFIGGITGQFFRQFAVTIAVSTIISVINAVTMTPSRAVMIFKTGEGEKHEDVREALPWWTFGVLGGLLTVWLSPRFLEITDLARQAEETLPANEYLQWAIWFIPGAVAGGAVGRYLIRSVNAVLRRFFRGFNRVFDGVTHLYGWAVGKLLHLSLVVLLVYGGLLVSTYWVFQKAPTGFIPQQDQGRLIVNIQLPDSASLERTQEAVAQLVAIARETPGVAHTVAISGLSFIMQANSPNFASMFIVLDAFDKRQSPELRDTAIMAGLRKEWTRRVKDAKVTVYGASPIPGLGVAGGFKLVVEDRGSLGLDSLQRQTDNLVRKLQTVPGLTSVATQFRSSTPQLWLDIDRTKVASLGVSFDDLNRTLSMYLGSLYVNSFNFFGRHWQVTIQAEGRYRDRIEDINLFQVRNRWQQMVPLGTLIQPREIGGPISVTRYNLYQSATVNGNVQDVSTGVAIAAIDALAAETLPLSMRTEWTELMFMQIRAGNTAIYVFLLSILCVFMALAALYESWTLPLAVILVVPLCLLCSVAGVLYTQRDVNIFVQIGLVVLVGLACKNAILVVEYARQLHEQGRPVFEVTQEASRLRLRPILMTSFAFVFGVLPLVFASGAGAEMRRSLGTAVFSGMLGVTLFGIFLTPVFFYVIQGISETRLFAAATTRWIGSAVLGGLVGLASGYLLARLGVARLSWALAIGGMAGALGGFAVLGVHRQIMPKRADVEIDQASLHDPGAPSGAEDL
ncbi:MAG: efflux RND transporter permease subunit [Isosphaeraceae bacterium]